MFVVLCCCSLAVLPLTPVFASSGDGQRVHPLSGPSGVWERGRQHRPGSSHADCNRPAAAGGAHAQERWGTRVKTKLEKSTKELKLGPLAENQYSGAAFHLVFRQKKELIHRVSLGVAHFEFMQSYYH